MNHVGACVRSRITVMVAQGTGFGRRRCRRPAHRRVIGSHFMTLLLVLFLLVLISFQCRRVPAIVVSFVIKLIAIVNT